jgi:hypothetical protein
MGSERGRGDARSCRCTPARQHRAASPYSTQLGAGPCTTCGAPTASLRPIPRRTACRHNTQPRPNTPGGRSAHQSQVYQQQRCSGTPAVSRAGMRWSIGGRQRATALKTHVSAGFGGASVASNPEHTLAVHGRAGRWRPSCGLEGQGKATVCTHLAFLLADCLSCRISSIPGLRMRAAALTGSSCRIGDRDMKERAWQHSQWAGCSSCRLAGAGRWEANVDGGVESEQSGERKAVAEGCAAGVMPALSRCG